VAAGDRFGIMKFDREWTSSFRRRADQSQRQRLRARRRDRAGDA
jgi:hypothetical protein